MLGIAALGVLRGCGGPVPIRTLLDDPSRFDGKHVSIAGEVRGTLAAFGGSAYRVSDGTGILPVLSATDGTPRAGSRIGLEGTFRAALTIGAEIAPVLVEQRRYIP